MLLAMGARQHLVDWQFAPHLRPLAAGRDKVEMLLAMGATRMEASREVVQRAARMALTPLLNTMNVVVRPAAFAFRQTVLRKVGLLVPLLNIRVLADALLKASPLPTPASIVSITA